MHYPRLFAQPWRAPMNELCRDVLGHLWRPQTAMEIVNGTGYQYAHVRGALFALKIAGLAIRRRRPGVGGAWIWEAHG